jgi:hypothetical protein
VANRIETDSAFTKAIGSETRATSRIGGEGRSLSRIGGAIRWYVATVRAGGVIAPEVLFTNWGQTDIFFGGAEMDVPFSELD